MTTVEEIAKVTYPKWVSKDQKQIIEAAQLVGWTLHLSPSAMQVKLVAPGGERTMLLDNKHPVNRKRDAKIIARYADPLKVELAIASVEVGNRLPREVQDAILAGLTSDGDKRVVILDEKPDPVEGYVDVPDEVLDADPLAEYEGLVEDRETYEDESSTVEPTIVSENFMLVKASDGAAYRSEHTIERHWSDGGVDYKCVRCDYTETGRKSVPAHQQVHVREGEARAGKPDTFKAEVPDAMVYRPRQSRVDALAAFLLEQLGEGLALDSVEDIADVARLALNWQHEQSRKGTEFAAETEEMTAEDMLARIRRMVASDALSGYESRISVLEENLSAVSQRNADLVAQVQAAQEKARRAQETLHSFIELAREMDAEPDPDKQG